MLIGPAPSSSGGASSLTCTITVVGLRLTPATGALPGERDERVGGRLLPVEEGARLLVVGALLLGDAPDGFLEHQALVERKAPAEHELTPRTRPRHAQRATLMQRRIVLDSRRSERTRGDRDLSGRLADGDARQLGIGAGRRVPRGSRNLVERQRARAQRAVERRQAAQRDARARDALGGAVIAAADLRQPLRTRRAARRLPIAVVIRLAHDLRHALLDPRLLLAERAQLVPARLAAALARLVDRPFQRGEHMFV